MSICDKSFVIFTFANFHIFTFLKRFAFELNNWVRTFIYQFVSCTRKRMGTELRKKYGLRVLVGRLPLWG